jgi:hypothetical protein
VKVASIILRKEIKKRLRRGNESHWRLEKLKYRKEREEVELDVMFEAMSLYIRQVQNLL